MELREKFPTIRPTPQSSSDDARSRLLAQEFSPAEAERPEIIRS
jgi:hypothetical protein